MKITSKGQVTIPLAIREKYGINQYSEVDFVEENGKVYIQKVKDHSENSGVFHTLRGCASVKMTTDEIMKLTRGDE